MSKSTDSAAAAGLPIETLISEAQPVDAPASAIGIGAVKSPRIPKGKHATIIPVAEMPRRAFLSQLIGLPLIGGGLSLVGQPSAASEPVTAQLLEAYKTWLHYEMRFLHWEMATHPVYLADHPYLLDEPSHFRRSKIIGGHIDHIGVGDAHMFHRMETPPPSSRAAVVMSAVGCEWKERSYV